MASQATSKKRLALAMINFLNTSATDGTIDSEDVESIEIATNCIAEAFKVDASDTKAMADALGGQNLLSIYSVYEKLKGRSTPSTEGPSSATEARPATPQTSATGAGGKEEAEKLKGQGNAAMQKKDYKSAIEFYTKALDLTPLNPIYLSNRAAAYSGSQMHEEAKQDAEMAVAADPKYTKAWSRLGLAKYALGDAKGSMEAYKAGIDAEGSGGSDAMKRGYETAKRKYEEEAGDVGAPDASRGMPGGGAGSMPDLSALAGMFGGGGGAGAGGMPDLGALMNNPMMRQMAQNLMSNPDAMNNLMSNPRLREMAENFSGGGGGQGVNNGGQGGGMPDLSSLMNDPSIAEM
ncbi:small glutamine-rich tetratricopeptide repeat-containing protein A [Pseudovirgaria hyperparasitica]|uniref:Small glutamine-rich tetratricopeptide repeat-containing protein A n=1 Tax=Pseudovirgaria hyperparasitica TaxID=470096 RepID=A0A6A6WIW1_9PEZI|nr:small glutamine-rich tetratricopeptide repeat-containing protein A [Pseudovirgaria hyperparasitica]KAF2762036.1 small glutamine-rich tetratricopeptide repeat-containing protein A [Pseudovirgaria hyperparasitica]